jgi:hypothetical protein
MFTYEDFSFLFAKEERKLSKSLAAFRQLFEQLSHDKRDRLIEQTKRLIEANYELDDLTSQLSITMHCVEDAPDDTQLNFELPPAVLLLAMEKWANGELFVPHGIDLYFFNSRIHPSYGARDGL